MIRYAITSRAHFPGDDPEQQAALRRQVARLTREGVDFIQLREKDLTPAGLANLTRDLLRIITAEAAAKSAAETQPTTLLINSRADIAIAAGAPGVHLTAAPGELTPTQVRSLFAASHLPPPIISLACHTLAEITRARSLPIDAILFAPVFEKPLPGQPPLPGQSLDRLRQACNAAAPIPVFALGGVTRQNTASCLEAGAAGIAGIRLFLS